MRTHDNNNNPTKRGGVCLDETSEGPKVPKAQGILAPTSLARSAGQWDPSDGSVVTEENEDKKTNIHVGKRDQKITTLRHTK